MEFSKYNDKINENEFISSFTSKVNKALCDIEGEDYDTEDEYDSPLGHLSEYSLGNYLEVYRSSKRHLANSKLFRGETSVSLTLDDDSDLGLQSMMEIMLAERPHDGTRYLMKWLLVRGYQQCILNLPINLTMEDLLENQSNGYTGSWLDFFDALEMIETETRPNNEDYRDLPSGFFGNIEDYKITGTRHVTNCLLGSIRKMDNILLDIDWQENSMEELSSHFDEHKWNITSLDIAVPCKNIHTHPFSFHGDYIINLSTKSLKITQGQDIRPSQEMSQEELCEILSLGILDVLTDLIVQKNIISFILPDIETYIADEEEVYKRMEEFNTGLNEDLDIIYSLVSDDAIVTVDFVLKIFNEMIDYYKSMLVELFVTKPEVRLSSIEFLERLWSDAVSSNTAMKFALNPFGEVSPYHHNQSEDEIDSRIVKQFNQLPKFGKQLKFIIRKCKEQWKKMTPHSFAYQKGFNAFWFYKVIKKYPKLKQPLGEVVSTSKNMYGYLDTPLTNYLADKIYGDAVEAFKNQFTETFWNDLYARVSSKLDYKAEVGSEPVTISLEQKDILTASFSGYSWTSCHAGSYLQSPFALAANDVTFVAYGSGGRDVDHLNGTVDKKRYRTYCHYAEVGDDFMLSVEGIYPYKSTRLVELVYKALCKRIGVEFDDLVRVDFPVFGQPGCEVLETTIISGYYDYYENSVPTYMTKNLYNQLKNKAMELLESNSSLAELDDFYDELLLACDSGYSSDLTNVVGRLERHEIYKGIQLLLLQDEISKLIDGRGFLSTIDSQQRYWETVAETVYRYEELEDYAMAYYLYAYNLTEFGNPAGLSITQHAMAAHDLLNLSGDYYNDEIFSYDFYPNPWGDSYRELYAIE